MAYEIPGFTHTLVAGADLSANQFRFVDNVGGLAVRPTAGGRVVGVQNNLPRDGEATTVVASGISIVEAGSAIVAGADVYTDALGRAVATGTTKAGVAQEPAPGAGIFIAVHLNA